MTVTENTTGPIPEATPSASPTPKRPVLTWHGLKTVAQLELMQRVRSSRWKTTLLLWFIGVGAICVLIATAIQANSYGTRPVGAAIFAANVYFILFMGLLITPTLSSTAINGDRDKGTLAILQASLLTPLEITLGKLAASWFASLAFLFVSVPFIFWAFAAGGVSARAVFSSLIMMAFLLLVVCAVSLYFSARTPKLAGSTVSSYGFVAFTCLISLIIWGLLLATVTSTVTVRQYSGVDYDSVTGDPTRCEMSTYTEQRTHQDKFWPLLALNPFVLVADVSAPQVSEFDSRVYQDEYLRELASGVRQTRLSDAFTYTDSWCTEDGQIRTRQEYNDYQAISKVGDPVWPVGVAIHLVIGGLAVWRTTKRLSTPYAELPKGVRIA
ncbi:ABC transporter permease [Populibacterium corticicola]|uniref:ABC transporter permease n=1 Tax=Populibacterium corticicola TaxID=1812826 RepID=A0ABW5XC20_9MICO